MAVDKRTGRALPTGIINHQNGYLGRFQYNGESYSVSHKDLNTLIEMLEDKKYEVRHGMCAKPSKMTFADWFNKWISERQSGERTMLKESSYHQYMNHFKVHIPDSLKKKKLQSLVQGDIQRLFNSMGNEKNIYGEYKYSYNTLKAFRNMLSGIFTDAVNDGLLKSNPVTGTKIYREDGQKEHRVLTVEEAVTFLDYAKSNELYYFFVTALETGMRCGELCALQWDCIDFRKKVIHIRHTLQYYNGIYTLGSPKTKTSKRSIVMSDKLYSMLLEWADIQKGLKAEMENRWNPLPHIDNLVFSLNSGKPLSKRKVYDEIDKVVKAVNEDGIWMAPINSHAFRHTFATRCLENHVEPKFVQKMLGHKKLQTTLDLYSHVLESMERKEINKLNGWEYNS